MTRYAMVEYKTGAIASVQGADNPIEACRLSDEEIGLDGETRYIERGLFEPIEEGFDVYVAPDGFDFDDGWDPAEITKVKALPHVARIESRTIYEEDVLFAVVSWLMRPVSLWG